MIAARLLIVDDHEIVRMSVRTLFANKESFEVCGEAQTVTEAVLMVPELSPDIVILDLGLPGMNGFETAARIRLIAPSTRIVFFSFHETPIAAQFSGADAFVSKSSPLEEIAVAVNDLLDPRRSEKYDAAIGSPETRFAEIGVGYSSARIYDDDSILRTESTERRRQSRTNLSLVVRIRPFDSSLLWEDCTTMNVSDDGIYFATSIDQYVRGVNVYVTTDFHRDSPMDHAVAGVVVRVKQLKHDKWGVAVNICSRLPLTVY